LKPKQAFFSQGNAADSIFYLQKGRAKITVVSKSGKEATIALLSPGDFVGEESLATVGGRCMTTATAITSCAALKIERAEMVRKRPRCTVLTKLEKVRSRSQMGR
jgi:CRP/FNR family cyclic AMP-dependent transcriptional regulator